jgi:hypothetical protein
MSEAGVRRRNCSTQPPPSRIDIPGIQVFGATDGSTTQCGLMTWSKPLDRSTLETGQLGYLQPGVTNFASAGAVDNVTSRSAESMEVYFLPSQPICLCRCRRVARLRVGELQCKRRRPNQPHLDSTQSSFPPVTAVRHPNLYRLCGRSIVTAIWRTRPDPVFREWYYIARPFDNRGSH